MKKNILLILLAVCTFAACKKSVNGTTGNSTGTVNIIPASSVPAAVISAFNSSFSSATEIEWQHNNDDSFTCQFNMENERHEVHFDGEGHESSHHVISTSAIPSGVLDAFRNAFPNVNILEWKQNNDGTWKAEFIQNGVSTETTIDANGNIIKTEHD